MLAKEWSVVGGDGPHWHQGHLGLGVEELLRRAVEGNSVPHRFPRWAKLGGTIIRPTEERNMYEGNNKVDHLQEA